MKSINEYLQSGHLASKEIIKVRTTSELIGIVRDRIHKDPAANLNDLDVSDIKIFDNVFMQELFHGREIKYTFDVSKWDVSNATSMQSIFRNIDYKGDLSKWDVSNVLDFDHAFADSIIDANLSSWQINNDANKKSMFARTAIPYSHIPQNIQ